MTGGTLTGTHGAMNEFTGKQVCIMTLVAEVRQRFRQQERIVSGVGPVTAGASVHVHGGMHDRTFRIVIMAVETQAGQRLGQQLWIVSAMGIVAPQATIHVQGHVDRITGRDIIMAHETEFGNGIGKCREVMTVVSFVTNRAVVLYGHMDDFLLQHVSMAIRCRTLLSRRNRGNAQQGHYHQEPRCFRITHQYPPLMSTA